MGYTGQVAKAQTNENFRRSQSEMRGQFPPLGSPVRRNAGKSSASKELLAARYSTSNQDAQLGFHLDPEYRTMLEGVAL